MRAHAAIPDGLVHVLGLRRPAKTRPTPSQEIEEGISRENRVARTLALIGKAFSAAPPDDVNPSEVRNDEAPSKKEGVEGASPQSEEEEPVFFRCTRVYAGFKRRVELPPPT